MTGLKEYFTFNIRDKRFFNSAIQNNIKDWESNLPNGYKDRLGKIYNNELTEFEEYEVEECPF